MHHHQAKQRRAFTLVELLVVIGIIAVLIGILLPALNRARQSANTIKCLANLRSIGQAIMIYSVQYKGSLPYGQWDGIGSPDGVTPANALTKDPASNWATLILGSMGKMKGPTLGDLKTQTGAVSQQIFACPLASERENSTGRTLHYGCHPRLMPDLDTADPASPLPAGQKPLLKPYKVSKIRNSSEIAMIWDAVQILDATGDGNALPVCNGVDQDGFYRCAANDTDGAHVWNSLMSGKRAADGVDVNLDQAVYTANKDYTGGPPYTASAFADIRWRHSRNNMANFIYADGHADSRELKKNVDSDFKLRNLYVNPQ